MMIQAVTAEDRAFVMEFDTHVTDSGYNGRCVQPVGVCDLGRWGAHRHPGPLRAAG